jgi:hypothetical protein
MAGCKKKSDHVLAALTATSVATSVAPDPTAVPPFATTDGSAVKIVGSFPAMFICGAAEVSADVLAADALGGGVGNGAPCSLAELSEAELPRGERDQKDNPRDVIDARPRDAGAFCGSPDVRLAGSLSRTIARLILRPFVSAATVSPLFALCAAGRESQRAASWITLKPFPRRYAV